MHCCPPETVYFSTRIGKSKVKGRTKCKKDGGLTRAVAALTERMAAEGSKTGGPGMA